MVVFGLESTSDIPKLTLVSRTWGSSLVGLEKRLVRLETEFHNLIDRLSFAPSILFLPRKVEAIVNNSFCLMDQY